VECEAIYLGICWVRPAVSSGSVFSVGDFVQGLALLVIVYTVTDIRYRFRVAITPLPLYRLTFYLIGVVGFGTLFTDIWLKERWLVPESLMSQAVWQGMFAGLFLLLAMTWIFYAFIKPPIFCAANFRKFAQELYRVIVRGSDAELPVIANELVRSANALVTLSRKKLSTRGIGENTTSEGKMKPDVAGYAHDVLLLVGNRKLCRHVIGSSPITAMALFEAMTEHEIYNIPVGQFAKNTSAEAIVNKDSILHHEDEGYSSGLLGYLKPFSQAIYGNYKMVEALGSNNGSPLDIDYRIVWSWDAPQFEVYCRAVTITLKSYLHSDSKALGEQYPGAVRRLLIYGSKARGDAGPERDPDVLLIVNDKAARQKRQLRRVGYMLAAASSAVPSILAHTEDEWASRERSGSPFQRAVEHDAVQVL